MSARAAWRLHDLGFADVSRYQAGKDDWLVAGLPLEGRQAGVTRASALARSDVPTCRPAAADRPFLIDAVVDPDVPPRVSLSQAASMARALMAGDPDRRGVVRQTLREKLSKLTGAG